MQPYIIGIAGGSGSGKSTFINKIEGRFGDKIDSDPSLRQLLSRAGRRYL